MGRTAALHTHWITESTRRMTGSLTLALTQVVAAPICWSVVGKSDTTVAYGAFRITGSRWAVQNRALAISVTKFGSSKSFGCPSDV